VEIESRSMKHILMVLLVTTLPACAGVPSAMISIGTWVGDGLVQAQTGKGIVDGVVSDITGKDCKLADVFKSNTDVCKEILDKKTQKTGKEAVKSESNK